MARLEEIVAEIESEELGLERQFELFQEGMGARALLRRKLTEVQKSVEIVLKEAAERVEDGAVRPDEDPPARARTGTTTAD